MAGMRQSLIFRRWNPFDEHPWNDEEAWLSIRMNTYQNNLFGDGEFHGTWPCPADGWLTNLKVVLEAVADSGVTVPYPGPGSGTITHTLRKGGVSTTLAVSLTGTSTSGTSSELIAVSKGDLITLYTNGSSSNGNRRRIAHNVSMTFISANAGESIYPIGTYQPMDGSTSRQIGPFSAVDNWDTEPSGFTATRPYSDSIVAVAGAVTRYDVRLRTAPGPGASRRFRFKLNDVLQDGTGGTVDTTLTLSDDQTSGSLEFTLPCVPTDRIAILEVPLNNPASTKCVVSTRYTATTNGEYNLYFGCVEPDNTIADYYGFIHWGGAVINQGWTYPRQWLETDIASVCGIDGFTLTKLYARLNDAGSGTGVGVGRTMSLTPRKNYIDGNLTVTFTGATQNVQDETGSIAVVEGDRLSHRFDPTGTPLAVEYGWTFCAVGATEASPPDEEEESGECVTAPPVAECWEAHDFDDQQVRLLE